MSELETQIENRQRKREALVEQGVDPYPTRYEFDLEPTQVLGQYGERSAEDLEAEGAAVQGCRAGSGSAQAWQDLFCGPSRRQTSCR